jgi:hypothetical protein
MSKVVSDPIRSIPRTQRYPIPIDECEMRTKELIPFVY